MSPTALSGERACPSCPAPKQEPAPARERALQLWSIGVTPYTRVQKTLRHVGF